MDELSHEEVHDVVDRTVTELLAAAGVQAPPVDTIQMARGHLGMTVSLDRAKQRPRGRKQIVLREEPTEEQQQWTVAHEIGEHYKADLLRSLAVSRDESRPMSGESLANLFASHLLVPMLWFRSDAPALDFDLLELKKRYATASHEIIAWRLIDLPSPCIVTLVDNNHVQRRRSNAHRVRKELHPVELACQRYVHTHGEPHVVAKDGWTVQGWPVNRSGWEREILRSVVEDDGIS
jgi:Zn-dependent peptidase ImmA (M78 family)